MAPTATARIERVGDIEKSVFRSLMQDRDVDELNEVLRCSAKLLATEALTPVDDVDDFATAREHLELAWSTIVDALDGDVAAVEEVCTTDLVALLRRVRTVDNRVREAEVRRRQEVLTSVRDALGRFRWVTTVDQLVDLAPQVVCRLGFDRAIVSRIQESSWVTEALYVDGNADWAAEILSAGQQNPQHLGPAIHETEIVRRRSAMLVTQVQQDTDKVHRAVADASQSRSYVAAPIMKDADVIGFLHADRYFHRGDVDEFDRDLLSLFSEGFSFALERTFLQDRVEAMRAEVNRIATGAPFPGMGGPTMPQTATVAASQGWAATRGPARTPTSMPEIAPLLTRREIEVLRLMAAGDTNGRIASRLVLSEGTVKSHVKHILRKLGAANRAEAVSRWLMAENGQRTG